MSDFRILFVCLGNICRSPLAHAVLQNMAEREGVDLFIESCGMGSWHVGEPADSRMRQTAKKHGVVIDHLARRFQPADLDEYDLIIPMDDDNYRDLKRYMEPEHEDKVHLLREWDPVGPGAVPDPWYGGPEGFETVYTIVERSCRSFLEEIMKRIGK